MTLHHELNRLPQPTLGADGPGERPGQFNWLHSVAVDSEGSVYAAEVNHQVSSACPCDDDDDDDDTAQNMRAPVCMCVLSCCYHPDS